MNINLHYHQIDYNKYKHQGLKTNQKKQQNTNFNIHMVNIQKVKTN
jgi:hypothetical protein